MGDKSFIWKDALVRARVRASSFMVCAAVCAALAALPSQSQAQGVSADFDPKEPINFSADRLEVAEEERIATFTGNVRAVQSDLSLAADSVKVYYRPGGGGGDDGRTVGIGGSVSRIDTSGNVRIKSQGDLARGDWAIYDVDRSIIILGGKVTLQRGDTVIRGSRLELDLKTGRTRFAAVPLPGTDERVEGEFTPSGAAEKDPGS